MFVLSWFKFVFTGKGVKSYGTRTKGRLWSSLIRSDSTDEFNRDFFFFTPKEMSKREQSRVILVEIVREVSLDYKKVVSKVLRRSEMGNGSRLGRRCKNP